MERKRHPILEILIIALLIFGGNLLWSYLFSLLIAGKSHEEVQSIWSVMNWVKLIFPMIAAWLCMNVVERRSIGMGKLLAVPLCAAALMMLISGFIINYMAAFSESYLIAADSINRLLSPMITATLTVLFVNLFDSPKREAYPHDHAMHCGLFKHIMLLLFTFGIWLLIWNYRVTAYLNCVPGESKRSPGAQLLLCMFVPFYGIYWTYKSAQRIDILAKTANVLSDLAVPCLILEFFIPVIPPVLMQDKINRIIETE